MQFKSPRIRIEMEKRAVVTEECLDKCHALRNVPPEERLAILGRCASLGYEVDCHGPSTGQHELICQLPNETKVALPRLIREEITQ